MKESQKQEFEVVFKLLAMSFATGSCSVETLQQMENAATKKKKWLHLANKFRQSCWRPDGTLNVNLGTISFLAYHAATKDRPGNQYGSPMKTIIQRQEDNKFVLAIVDECLKDIYGREKRKGAKEFRKNLVEMIRATKSDIVEMARAKSPKKTVSNGPHGGLWFPGSCQGEQDAD